MRCPTWKSLLAQGTAGVPAMPMAANPLSCSTAYRGAGSTTGTAHTASTLDRPVQRRRPRSTRHDGGAAFAAGPIGKRVAQRPSSLFAKLDTDGNGQISQSEFETALGRRRRRQIELPMRFRQTRCQWRRLDQPKRADACAARRRPPHHHMHAGGGGQAGGSSGQSTIDSLLSSAGASGATTQTATNSDGSTTDDDFLCRRQHGRNDHAGGVDGWHWLGGSPPRPVRTPPTCSSN